jgi:hypothetical protein
MLPDSAVGAAALESRSLRLRGLGDASVQIDALKIDQSFVRAMTRRIADRLIQAIAFLPGTVLMENSASRFRRVGETITVRVETSPVGAYLYA